MTAEALTESEAQRQRRHALDEYARPHLGRSSLDFATSIVPYLLICAFMYVALKEELLSYWLVLPLAIPAAGFLLRTYILFHDCAHGSFLPWKKANVWLGTTLGLFVYSDFLGWRHNHAVHHATAGDLDRRGVGDVPTLTVEEYFSRSRRARIVYWLYRHPIVMFGLGPIYGLMVQPRLVAKDARARVKRSVRLTNVALAVVVGAVCFALGWQEVLLIQGPIALLAGAAGVWLFYVQHQFEDVYWENNGEWSYADAALRGSSYLKLPKVLQFFTGNIGLHHVHHLSARIPNYNLQRAHDENPVFHSVPTLTFWDGIKCTRLKLWDESQKRLVTFREARRAFARRMSSPGAAGAASPA